jgi:hypothetical protein
MRTIGRIAATVLCVFGAMTAGGLRSSASAADVRIGVNVGIPVPVVVVPTPPVVIAPGAPAYFYGENYFVFHNGAWFMAPRHGGPWIHYAGPPPWERHPGARHWREGRLHGGRHGN